jgi:NAD(P)-dependent dehydrogenase (short-subunit alcohol dehydrogenase family)
VVTGSASGIGRSTRLLAEEAGWRVIGIDLREAEIVADLSSPEGRREAVSAVTKIASGRIDGLALIAGIRIGDDAKEVAVNYFGVAEPLSALHDCLVRGSRPAAVVMSSFALLSPLCDHGIVEACLAGNEEMALAEARSHPNAGYPSSKLALAKLVRRLAPSKGWAGAGITLNAVAPGFIKTGLTAAVLADPSEMEKVSQLIPFPMGRAGEPEDVASVAVALLSPELRYVTGQIVFVDGGADALLRPDDIFTTAGRPYRYGPAGANSVAPAEMVPPLGSRSKPPSHT